MNTGRQCAREHACQLHLCTQDMCVRTLVHRKAAMPIQSAHTRYTVTRAAQHSARCSSLGLCRMHSAMPRKTTRTSWSRTLPHPASGCQPSVRSRCIQGKVSKGMWRCTPVMVCTEACRTEADGEPMASMHMGRSTSRSSIIASPN